MILVISSTWGIQTTQIVWSFCCKLCHGQLEVWMFLWRFLAHVSTHTHTHTHTHPLSSPVQSLRQIFLVISRRVWNMFLNSLLHSRHSLSHVPFYAGKSLTGFSIFGRPGALTVFSKSNEALSNKVQVHQVQQMSLECWALLTPCYSTSLYPWLRILKFSARSLMFLRKSWIFSCFL